MSITRAIELVAELEAVADVAVVILNPNDAVYASGVDDALLSNLRQFLEIIQARCRRLMIVVPRAELSPKFNGVRGYVAACESLLACLKDNNVSCTDATNLVGLVHTFDGEHFEYHAEPALLREGKGLRGLQSQTFMRSFLVVLPAPVLKDDESFG